MIARFWVLLPLAVTALAQPATPETAAVGRVLLFPEAGYRGEPLIVEADKAVSNLHSLRQGNRQRWNDTISSVRVEGPVQVVLYSDADYNGERLEVRRDTPDLTVFPHGPSKIETWDDRISSVKVSALPGYTTASQSIRSEFTSQRDADRAIRAAYRDLLGREPDNDGLHNYRRRLLDQGWTDLRLRASLRDSAEFKGRDFDAIVNRAYREILGREADPSGLTNYRKRLKDGWTEGDLRAELKRSGEAKDRVGRELVIRAYRDVLGREPDDQGMATYLKLIRDGWSEQRVRDTLKASEEYRNRPK